jgi:diacylglycerol kinase family enzyme
MTDRVVTVLLNPATGARNTPDLPSRLAKFFAIAGVQARIVCLASGAHAADAVRSAIASGAEAVVAGGGDGTVNSVASGLLGATTPLGVLPLGTLNHFAKDLGIPLDIEGAVRTIAARRVVHIDVGDVNGRIFLNNSSIGIYPSIVVERDALREKGYRKWIAFALASTRVVRRYRGVLVRLTAGDATKTFRTPFLFVGNNEYQVDGIRLGGRTRLDRGLLFAYFTPRLHGRELPKLVALALVGRAKDTGALESFAAAAFDVETPWSGRLRVALDGEVTRQATPLHYQVKPGAMRVIVPGR